MSLLIPVKYGKKNYPSHIICNVQEVAGNFDKQEIVVSTPYSLHTEYSYMPRKLDSSIVSTLNSIVQAQKDGIPQLWFDKNWALDFSTFVENLVAENHPPEVIEIHPPFNDYCVSFEEFIDIFSVFQERISNIFPNTKILLENRCGTMYKGGKFLISKCADVLAFCKLLDKFSLNLKIVLDYPQLFSAELIKMDNVKLDKILAFNDELIVYRHHIGGFHMWGKKKSQNGNRWTPHIGNFDTFFSDNSELKGEFLHSVRSTFSDNTRRYFVPEVNSSEGDVMSIVADMENVGFQFVSSDLVKTKQLIRIKWREQEPFFEFYDRRNGEVEYKSAIGKISFNISTTKYCIGSYELGTYKHIPCEGNQIVENQLICKSCDNLNGFKSCLYCRGDRCFTSKENVLNYCNQKHFVYLAYFPDEIIKVGTAHQMRKADRLIEQGALYRILLAEVPTGKIARKLESEISKLGYKSAITSKYKIKNIFTSKSRNEIFEFLVNAHKHVVNHVSNEFARYFIESADVIESNSIIETLNNISKQSNSEMMQLSLFDEITIAEHKYNIVAELSHFKGMIVTFVGSIALYQDEENNLCAYDFKKLYGYDLIF